MLAVLGNYGGPTATMPPLLGSPAIDAGDDNSASSFSTDQRGFARIFNTHVDIGAAELQGVAPVIVCPNNIVTTNDIGLCSAVVQFTANATGFPDPHMSC